MKAIISVVGKDTVGILAFVSDKCLKSHANIVEVSQTVLQEYFAMIMAIDISSLNIDFIDFVNDIEESGKARNLDIHVMHEDIFNAMHKI